MLTSTGGWLVRAVAASVLSVGSSVGSTVRSVSSISVDGVAVGAAVGAAVASDGGVAVVGVVVGMAVGSSVGVVEACHLAARAGQLLVGEVAAHLPI